MGDADAMKRSDEEEAREEARDDALEGGGEAAQGDVCCAGLLGGAAEGAGARAKHSVLFALALLLQWVVRDYLDEALVNASPMLRDDCSGAPFQQAPGCHRVEAVLRISLACVLFFGALALATYNVTNVHSWRAKMHAGYFLPKLLALGALIALALFAIPAGLANFYGHAARIGAGLFLLMQWLVLIKTLYAANAFLLGAWESYGKVVLPLVTLAAYGLAFTLVAFCFEWFAPRGGCSLNIALTCIALLLGLSYTALSLVPKVEHAGIFTSGLLFAYLAFLTMSAMASEPASENCNTLNGDDSTVGWREVVSFVIAIITVVVVSFNVGAQGDVFSLSNDEDEAVVTSPPDRPSYSYAFANIAVVLTTMYGTMLLLGWELHDTQGKMAISDGWTSLWVQIISSWIGGTLYAWSLLAPLVFPDRDFS